MRVGVPSLADLLDPTQRDRLAALGTQDHAAAARAALAESTATGRVAWALVVVALERARTADDARDILAAMVTDEKLRTVAMACLAALTRDHDTAEEIR